MKNEKLMALLAIWLSLGSSYTECTHSMIPVIVSTHIPQLSHGMYTFNSLNVCIQWLSIFNMASNVQQKSSQHDQNEAITHDNSTWIFLVSKCKFSFPYQKQSL